MFRARLPRRLGDGHTFNMLRSNDLIWSFVVNNYLMGKEPFPFDLLYWNSDSTRMPAKMHSFYLRNMYMKNLLKEPGGIELAGVPIDISQDQGAGLLHLDHRRPHRAVEEHLPRRHALRRPGALRARRLRPHRRHRQSRRRPTSTATGPTPRRSCPPTPTSGSKAPRSTPAPGGPTGSSGCVLPIVQTGC
jgi:hypothetical protein